MPIKDMVYLGAIAVLAIGFFLYRASLIRDGEQKAQARELAASEKQAQQDALVTKQATDDLNDEIQNLRKLALTPVPVGVRCSTSRVPKAPATSRGTSVPATPGGPVPEVSSGTSTGPDLGPSLQRLAAAADLISAYDRACLTWAKGVSK